MGSANSYVVTLIFPGAAVGYMRVMSRRHAREDFSRRGRELESDEVPPGASAAALLPVLLIAEVS